MKNFELLAFLIYFPIFLCLYYFAFFWTWKKKSKVILTLFDQFWDIVLVIICLSKGNALVIKKAQLIPYTVDLQTKLVLFKELVVWKDKRVFESYLFSSCLRQPDTHIANNFARNAYFFLLTLANMNCNIFFPSEMSKKCKFGVSKKLAERANNGSARKM